MIERTTVRLPANLLVRARRKAAAERRTLTSLIEDGLRLVVADGRRTAVKGKRVLPPISKATGGPLPGVDLADLTALRETDDLDQVERMQRFK
jgi:NAD(P)H-nitrite reductase large subunit